MSAPDVLVIGLGAHGSALVHELARRGVAVTGIDAFDPPHAFGSTTGRTRVTREAYFEDPSYVPLVQRAGELWTDLEELTGTVLFRRTGGLMVGPEHGELVRGAAASARMHGLPHELLDRDAIRARFPALNPPDGAVAVYEQNAGVLLLDACIRTLLEQARGHGAQMLTNTRVMGWSAGRDGVAIETTAGTLRAAHTVFAAGAWLNGLLASERVDRPAQLRIEVERQWMLWTMPAPGVTGLRAEVCPVAIIENGGRMIYTVPDVGHGVKAGVHHEGAIVDPDRVDRAVSTREERLLLSMLEEWMPGSTYRVLDASVCLYTNTPDHHFAIGAHPSHENVTLVSACSGHGFKFAPSLAELVADIVMDGTTATDVPLFDVARLVA